MLDRMRII